MAYYFLLKCNTSCEFLSRLISCIKTMSCNVQLFYSGPLVTAASASWPSWRPGRVSSRIVRIKIKQCPQFRGRWLRLHRLSGLTQSFGARWSGSARSGLPTSSLPPASSQPKPTPNPGSPYRGRRMSIFQKTAATCLLLRQLLAPRVSLILS